MKEVASWLHLPHTSSPKTTRLQRRLRRSSGYVCSFLRRASRRAAPAKVPPVALAPLLTSVVIRGSYPLTWFPPHNGRPFAMTSILLSSWRCSRLDRPGGCLLFDKIINALLKQHARTGVHMSVALDVPLLTVVAFPDAFQARLEGVARHRTIKFTSHMRRA